MFRASSPKPRVAKTDRAQAGQALAEAALALPILILVMLALINFGQVAFVANTAKNAAQYGARMGAVAQTNPGGVALGAANSQLTQVPGGGEYAVSLLAPGGTRGNTLAVRVHWKVPNYFQGLSALFGGGLPPYWEGDADAAFRQEGW